MQAGGEHVLAARHYAALPLLKTLSLPLSLSLARGHCPPEYGTRSQTQLCYVGFSQGTAQAFAAFSSNAELLRKIYLFVALSPAARANHLSKSLLSSLVQANLRWGTGRQRLSICDKVDSPFGDDTHGN